MKIKKKTLIVGGGLAGVSTAYHLKSSPYHLIEREAHVGGTARSFKIKNFTFDFTGHLLHLHTPYTKKLITKLLNGNFYRCVRNTKIFSHNTYTPFPFQANTFGLPEDVRDECVLSLLDIHLNGNGKTKKNPHFKQWCLEKFGTGISKYFMIPYNEKLYQTPAEKMSADWCGPFVPTPKLEDMVRGSLVKNKTGYGYNQTFLYPKKGGIQVLSHKLARNLKNISLNTSLKSIDWKNKVATLSDGKKVEYTHLVNTIPLPELLKRMRNLPKEIKRASKKLKSVGILCLNVGVNRSRISDASWIYFPEKEFPFYRVGFPMNFTPHAVPRGCSSMYIEVPFKISKNKTKKEILKSVKKQLIKAKILRPKDRFKVAQFLPIKYAYVVYDHDRQLILPKIFKFLKKNKIQTIGRYGAWKYSFMEEAILDGKKAADAILR